MVFVCCRIFCQITDKLQPFWDRSSEDISVCNSMTASQTGDFPHWPFTASVSWDAGFIGCGSCNGTWTFVFNQERKLGSLLTDLEYTADSGYCVCLQAEHCVLAHSVLRRCSLPSLYSVPAVFVCLLLTAPSSPAAAHYYLCSELCPVMTDFVFFVRELFSLSVRTILQLSVFLNWSSSFSWSPHNPAHKVLKYTNLTWTPHRHASSKICFVLLWWPLCFWSWPDGLCSLRSTTTSVLGQICRLSTNLRRWIREMVHCAAGEALLLGVKQFSYGQNETFTKQFNLKNWKRKKH